jgi:glycosyltransferase involved in cell wall biosynthesis
MIYPALAGKANTTMKVLQILPEMNAGGVERGTLEIGRYLVQQGHAALVISNGGRMVAELETAGVRHIALPVHRKRLGSLFQVRPFRRLLETEKPDILHIRSRVPGWIAWLAWRRMNPLTRPQLVSTVHGFYSVNAYSAMMTKGERVIAVSESIRDYITTNYPRTSREIIRVIPRGIEPTDYPREFQPAPAWLQQWQKDFPQLAGRRVLTLPGRITRLKGHEDFLKLIAVLIREGKPAHGLIVGDVHPKKRDYLGELHRQAEQLQIKSHVTFTGHRTDLREILAVSDIVYSLSTQPESFGRTTLEALALGRPVVAYDHGGVGEQLRALFPAGRVALGDHQQLQRTTQAVLQQHEPPKPVAEPFTLAAMCRSTLAVYRELHPD